MAKALTTVAVKSIRPTDRRQEIRDGSTQGLYLVVEKSGSKSWALRFRQPSGCPAKLTLGRVDFSGQEISGPLAIGMPLSLSGARQLAAQVWRDRLMGKDVVADRPNEKAQRQEKSANTFDTLVTDFLSQHAVKTRNFKQTARVLGLTPDLQPIKGGLYHQWGGRALSEITANDVFQVVQSCRDRPVPGLRAKEAVSRITPAARAQRPVGPSHLGVSE